MLGDHKRASSLPWGEYRGFRKPDLGAEGLDHWTFDAQHGPQEQEVPVISQE